MYEGTKATSVEIYLTNSKRQINLPPYSNVEILFLSSVLPACKIGTVTSSLNYRCLTIKRSTSRSDLLECTLSQILASR